jgi:hypothetical protein
MELNTLLRDSMHRFLTLPNIFIFSKTVYADSYLIEFVLGQDIITVSCRNLNQGKLTQG